MNMEQEICLFEEDKAEILGLWLVMVSLHNWPHN